MTRCDSLPIATDLETRIDKALFNDFAFSSMLGGEEQYQCRLWSRPDQAVSEDGRLIAIPGEDGVVDVWEMVSGEKQATLTTGADDDDNPLTALAFSSDGGRIASGREDGTVLVWELAAGQPMLTFDLGARVNGLAFSPDGAWLAGGDWQEPATPPVPATLRLWDVASGTERAQLTAVAPDGGNDVLAFSPCGRFVAWGGGPRTLGLWELATRRQLFVGEAHREHFSMDVFQVRPGVGGGWFPEVYTNRIALACFSPDGQRLASICLGGEIHISEVPTGRRLSAPAGRVSWEWLRDVVRLPSGRLAIVGKGTAPIDIWA